MIPTPVYNDNHVYVTSGYGTGCNLFKIAKTNAGFTATQVYANKVMVNHHGGVLLRGDHIYGYSDGKGWSCQEFKTGKAVWQQKTLAKGSLIYADGRLYCREEGGRGTLALLEASPGRYQERGRFEQPDRTKRPSWSHPVIANGKLYIRDQDLLFAFDVRKK